MVLIWGLHRDQFFSRALNIGNSEALFSHKRIFWGKDTSDFPGTVRSSLAPQGRSVCRSKLKLGPIAQHALHLPVVSRHYHGGGHLPQSVTEFVDEGHRKMIGRLIQ